MKKISYTQNDGALSGPKNDLVENEIGNHIGGAAGISLQENTMYFDKKNVAPIPEEKEEKDDDSLPGDVISKLINISDSLDQSDQEHLASFTDFLIKKFSSSQQFDPEEFFVQLILKINNADIVNTNDLIKKICKIYSRTVVLEFLKNNDKKKSKESAYKKALHRANQYLEEESF